MFLRADLRRLDRLRADVSALGAAGGARLMAEIWFRPCPTCAQCTAMRSGYPALLRQTRSHVGGASGSGSGSQSSRPLRVAASAASASGRLTCDRRGTVA